MAYRTELPTVTFAVPPETAGTEAVVRYASIPTHLPMIEGTGQFQVQLFFEWRFVLRRACRGARPGVCGMLETLVFSQQ